MRRRLFTLCSAASLVGLVAVCVLWVRSYWGSDHVSFWHMSPPSQAPGNVEVNLVSVRGRVRLERLAQVFPAEEYAAHWHARVGRGWTATAGRTSYRLNPNFVPDPSKAFYSGRLLGFQYANFSQGTPTLPGSFRGVVVPLWSIAVLLAPLPLARLRAWHRLRRRARGGLCARCGYDLRASPARCPECGASAKAVNA